MKRSKIFIRINVLFLSEYLIKFIVRIYVNRKIRFYNFKILYDSSIESTFMRKWPLIFKAQPLSESKLLTFNIFIILLYFILHS